MIDTIIKATPYIGVALLCSIFGPLIGGYTSLLMLFASDGINRPSDISLLVFGPPLLLLLGFKAVYFIGFIPAFLSGLIYSGLLSKFSKVEPLAFYYRAGLGALSGCIPLALFALYQPHEVTLALVYVGAITGAILSLFIRRLPNEF